MSVSALLNYKRKFGVGLIGMFLSLVFALSPATTAQARFTDHISFTQCTGRFSMGTVQLKGGRVTAYGCSNKYFYVTTVSTSRANLVASLDRTKKYPTYTLKSASQVYQVTTNMLYRLDGACYRVWGSISPGSGNGWTFCW
jgi:hypothetical protein